MLNNFFTFTPNGNGTDIIHQFWVVVLVIVGIVSILQMKGKNRKFEVFMGITLATFLLVYHGWYAINPNNVFITKGLPLYHCSISAIIQSYYLITGRKPDLILKDANAIALGGAIFGILFPTAFNHQFAFPHLMHIGNFGIHALFILVGVYYIWVRNVRLSKKEYWNCIKILAIWDIVIHIFNRFVGTNYSFVNRCPFKWLPFSPVLELLACFLIFCLGYWIEYKLIPYKEEKE